MRNNLKKFMLLLTVVGAMALSSGCTVDIYGDWPEAIVIEGWGGGHHDDDWYEVEVEYDD